MENSKTAFIAIVGRPNVGKSSILNHLIGEKIAIVSQKPQTTRNRIMGILTSEEYQLVFIDTPGLHKPKNKLGDYMITSIKSSVASVDAALLVLDATAQSYKVEDELIANFEKNKIPAILAINKIDLVKDKTQIATIIENMYKRFKFNAIVPICAKSGLYIDSLINELKKLALPGIHMFNDDDITDQPERIVVSEIIREKLLRLLNREVPHGIFVSIDSMKERNDKDLIDLQVTIYCEKSSHKGIIIGNHGDMLKKVGIFARNDIEKFLDCKVNLQLWVKVKEDWRNKEAALHSFGYDKSSLEL